jgi:hypothetical protein
MQTSAVLAPTATENSPTGHAMQVSVVCAVSVLYLPATQFVHCASAEAPTADDHVPAGQATHVSVVCAVSVLYLPATQFVQCASAEAPTADDHVPAGHILQTLLIHELRSAFATFAPTELFVQQKFWAALVTYSAQLASLLHCIRQSSTANAPDHRSLPVYSNGELK